MTSIAKSARKIAGALILAAVLGVSIGGPAHADDWRDHEVHARYWHVHHPHPVPHVVYAPPVIYQPPPPPVSPGLNLIFPLNIR